MDRDCAGNRHNRLLRCWQITDARVRIDAAPHAFEGDGRGLPRPAPGDQAVAARVTGDYRHVFGDRHGVDEAEILVDESDRQGVR